VVMLRAHPHVRGGSYLHIGETKEAPMPSLNQQTRPHGTGSGKARWIVIAVAVAVVAVGIVLLVLYGGGGSSAGY
jgi:hypothetical protein